MSTKVKIAIAAAIVVALVGLIILDQRSGGPKPSGVQMADTQPAGGVTVESDLQTQLRDAGNQIGTQASQNVNGQSAPVPGPATQSQPANPNPTPVPPPPSETYEVQSGDSLYVIAERKYGDGNLWKLIADANPKANPKNLRLGSKLVIPPKPSVASEAAGATNPVQEVAHRTSPELDMPVVTGGTAAPGTKTYRVKSGDSLWKIAKACSNGKGIVETMNKIKEANPDKIRSAGAALQVDWVLVVPD